MTSTNDVFGAFEQQVLRSQFWLRTRIRGAFGVPAGVLVDRLAQRLVELALGPYNLAVYAGAPGADKVVPPPTDRIDIGRGLLWLQSGRIQITAKQWLANQLEFLKHWTYCLMAIVRVVRNAASHAPGLLVYGTADEQLFKDGRDDRFVQYCRQGPITVLREPGHLFVESISTTASSAPNAVTYCRRPLTRLAREARLGVLARLSLIARHFSLLIQFEFASLRAPELSLIGADMAYCAVAAVLDERGLLGAIVLTCSNWGWQPIWMRELRRAHIHMIWYSQNPQSATYVTDTVKSDGPQMRWILAGTHWVWTWAFANYIETRCPGRGRVKVVGPIVWQLPAPGRHDSGAINILAFDVPAVRDDIMRKFAGEITNYYAQDNLRAFIAHLLALKTHVAEAFGRPVNLKIKMKRGLRPHYAKEYFEYVEKISAEGSLTQVSPDENPYALVSSSDLVIAYPFTSPAYLAESLGVPAIYYDPTQSLVPEYFNDSATGIRFVHGPDQLHKVATALLRQKDVSK